MKRLTVFSGLTAALLATACAPTAFNGPIKPVRLSHIDGNVEAGRFACEKGKFTAIDGSGDTVEQFNLAHRFSDRVCTSLFATGEKEEKTAAQAMIDSGFTLVKARCNDFFAAKVGNQGRARVTRGLLQPLTTAITATFAVINFGSESSEEDALSLLTAGTVLGTAVLDLYEEQFLFDADNVDSVRGMTMRALRASEIQITEADITTFDRAVRALTDHQMTCTPGNILELVRQSIEDGDFRPRERPDNNGGDEQDEQTTQEQTGQEQDAQGRSDTEQRIQISAPPP